jgi:hypothetical protein
MLLSVFFALFPEGPVPRALCKIKCTKLTLTLQPTGLLTSQGPGYKGQRCIGFSKTAFPNKKSSRTGHLWICWA